MARKLHIGGRIAAAGWEIMDANPAPNVDHAGNARDLSRFGDATFEAIYASHVVEHFDYAGELQHTLAEWKRTLEPGGRVYISVPDLDVLARMILDKQRLSEEERFLVMRMMFGGHIDQYDYHVVGLNEEFLRRFLRDAVGDGSGAEESVLICFERQPDMPA